MKSAALHLNLVALFFLLFLSACVAGPKRVVILVDGNRRVVDTDAVTVQDVLNEQKIALGENDRVEPPLYAEVGRSETVRVTRVQVDTEAIRQPIPFGRRILRDEAYPNGQMQVVQLGVNGEAAITYTITVENGVQVERRETGRRMLTEPKDEILAIGTRGSLPSVPITGTIAYQANGNIWVMRNSSGDKRILTTTGDLDGRAFSLSADGRYVLFSRAAEASSKSLNTLWIMDTLVLGEMPRALPISDVLFAQLAPDARSIIYSTGEKTDAAPGWKANNDLWLASLSPSELSASPPVPMTINPRKIWSATIPAPYGWWGANFAWSPDGSAVAYAFSNEVGFSQIPASGDREGVRVPLKRFAPFRSPSDWVWTPQVTWSPDSRFVAAAIHAPLENLNVASDNPSFELWGLARDRTALAPLAKQTGMWAAPVWSPADANSESMIAFGVALSPSDSERSRYALFVMDRDGGNKMQIFPQGKEDGLVVVQVAWSPDVRQLVAVRDGDLWLYDFASARWSPLTANGAAALPRWAK